MKVSQNFFIEEFVPPEIWERFGNNAIWFINPKIILINQFIRERFKVEVTVNNWKDLGQYKESGFRMPETKTGARLSQHKLGNASDTKVEGFTAEEVRNDIRKNFDLYSKFGLSTIEKDTDTWTHIDCRATGLDHLFEVNIPK